MDIRTLKEFLLDVIKYFMVVVGVLILVVYVCSLQQVVGSSMSPNLKNGDVLLINKIIYKFRKPSRFEIITFQHDNSQYLIKRVIGLPGETIFYEDGLLYIDNVVIDEPFINNIKTDDFNIIDIGYGSIPNNMYLVIGDNRTDSDDSRNFGLIQQEKIIGKPFFKIIPFKKMSIIE